MSRAICDETIDELIVRFEEEDKYDMEGFPLEVEEGYELAEIGGARIADYFMGKLYTRVPSIWDSCTGPVVHLAEKDGDFFERLFNYVASIVQESDSRLSPKAAILLKKIAGTKQRSEQRMPCKKTTYGQKAESLLKAYAGSIGTG